MSDKIADFYKDTGLGDQLETLYSSPDIAVRRYRMRKTSVLENLESGPNESLVVPLAGEAEVSLRGGEVLRLGRRDVAYLPRDSVFTVRRVSDSCELVWATAPASARIPPYVKRYRESPEFESGSEACHRKVVLMIGDRDPAERLLAGYTESAKGNWTGFPPHRHDSKPEVYVFTDMGEKFGLQTVFTENEEEAFVVHQGDAIGFRRGYHPNVADPSSGLTFFWTISAPPDARNLSVNVHPGYRDVSIGKTPLKVD